MPVTPTVSVIYATVVTTADNHVSACVYVSVNVDITIDSNIPVHMNVSAAVDSLAAVSAASAPRVGLGQCCSDSED